MTFANLVDSVIVPLIDNTVLPLLYVLAFLFFLVGVARFFFAAGEENREKGKQFALWGIIAFFVLASVWGIVHMLLAVIQP